jgi:hypothetical protein
MHAASASGGRLAGWLVGSAPSLAAAADGADSVHRDTRDAEEIAVCRVYLRALHLRGCLPRLSLPPRLVSLKLELFTANTQSSVDEEDSGTPAVVRSLRPEATNA